MTCSKCNAEIESEPCPQCTAAENVSAGPPAAGGLTPSGDPSTAQPKNDNQQAENAGIKPVEDGSNHADKQDGEAGAGEKPSNERKPKKKNGEREEPEAVHPQFSPKIKESQLHDFLAATGINNTVIGKLVHSAAPAESPTVFDHLENFLTLPASMEIPLDESELATKVETFESERILLLVCSDREIARVAGNALMSRVRTTARRMLSFSGLPPALLVNVHALMRRPGRGGEMLVLVDAFEGERARTFVDSLFAEGAFGKANIRSGLERVRIRMACVASEQDVAGRIHRFEFGHWIVSRAALLLHQHCPAEAESLQAKIAEQRHQGNWSRSPAEFQAQIEELIRSGDLQKVVEKGGPLAAATISSSDAQAPVADGDNSLSVAVLYAATFYPNLAPNEFAQIVGLIIGDQRTLVPESVQQKTKDGTFRMVELKREKRLAEIWSERTDSILRDCRLITSREAGRTIAFADVGRRDLLRRHFDEQYGAYVQRQFQMAWEKGLLFDRSARIAAAVTSLTVDMAVADPLQFDRDWLAGRVVYFIESDDDRSLVLQRTSDLLRTMLRHEPLIPLVSGVVQRLLQLGRDTDALALVQALRLAPEFDNLHWLRQILDRGSNEIHGEVGSYLINELHRADPDILRYVTALADKWLPPDNLPPKNYLPSNKAALLTVSAYCFNATYALNADWYGLWPSRFAIFAVDRASAATQFSALLRCLFHPGLTAVLRAKFEEKAQPEEVWEEEKPLREIARLLSRWVFILYGLSDQAPEAEEEGLDFRRDDALEVLVEQLLAVTKGSGGRAQRAVIVDEWEWAKAIYLNAPSRMGEEGHRRRRELGAKRRLMHDLIAEFRRQQRAEQKAAAPTPQTATA